MFELNGPAGSKPLFKTLVTALLKKHLLRMVPTGCDAQWPDAKHEKRHFSITKESLTSIPCSALMKTSDLECQWAGSFSATSACKSTKNVSV